MMITVSVTGSKRTTVRVLREILRIVIQRSLENSGYPPVDEFVKLEHMC